MDVVRSGLHNYVTTHFYGREIDSLVKSVGDEQI